jgi:hypothetical protein
LDQVRIIQEDVPEPPYHLAISLRLIRNHKLDGAQCESEKRVSAAPQRRLYGGGTDKFPYSHNLHGIRKVVREPQQTLCRLDGIGDYAVRVHEV